ncbi:MAG: DtxR family transcriptional regulator [bacterium]|nr:DtxR family transcriptional regulator [bacterium]
MDALELTQSQEDYLETIHDLIQARGEATISRIARRLDVAKPSVVKAIKRLSDMGLVSHKPYGDVVLTKDGADIAETVRMRHDILVKFLTNFLGVNQKRAEKDACLLEHNLSECTTERLIAFIELNDESAVRIVKGENFAPGTYIERDTCEGKDIKGIKMFKNLDELEVGQKGKIVSLNAKGKIRRRLQDFGVVKNVIVEVVNTAPLNDPIDLKIKGFDLALRRKEAALIEVEVTE